MKRITLWLGEADMKKCFPCHQVIKDRDFIFSRYAPVITEAQAEEIRP